MPRPRLIEREQVVDAALRMLDEHGLEGLSLERIAGDLGVTGPALYNHFKSKDDILRAVSERVLGGPDVGEDSDPPPDADYLEWTVKVSKRFFVQASAHPRAALVLLTHLPTELQDLGFASAARLMAVKGVPPRAQHLIMEGTQRLVWGWILHYSDVFAASRRRTARSRDPYLVEARNAALAPIDMVEQSVRSFVVGVLARTAELEKVDGRARAGARRRG
jgi:AcrR family transcriptional regulator